MNENKLSTDIVTIGKFLQYEKLRIPNYQRPYKWTTKNVTQLLEDINTFRTKQSYRIGTVVIHDDGKHLNIVDGQQRTITFLLITKAIVQYKLNSINDVNLVKLLSTIQASFIPEFSNEISFKNIKDNYKEIERRVVSLEEDFIDFFFNKCEVTQFVLTNISEAFQFFDSQNARGKDLEPHDLLKAFHLREFAEKDKPNQSLIIDQWEDMATEELTTLFGNFLYRIKGWCKGNSSRYFSKNDTPLFKGVNFSKNDNFPFIELLKISDTFVNEEAEKKEFPFQLDQIIINGKRFFEMVAHYQKIFKEFNAKRLDKNLLSDNSNRIFTVISSYEGKERTGDKYVRMLFNCALIYYIDKFGYKEISYAVEKIFVWAYSVRLEYQNIQMASIDNYVVHDFNIFKKIRDSFDPRDIINLKVPIIEARNVKGTKTEEIIELFKELKYYE